MVEYTCFILSDNAKALCRYKGKWYCPLSSHKRLKLTRHIHLIVSLIVSLILLFCFILLFFFIKYAEYVNFCFICFGFICFGFIHFLGVPPAGGGGRAFAVYFLTPALARFAGSKNSVQSLASLRLRIPQRGTNNP